MFFGDGWKYLVYISGSSKHQLIHQPNYSKIDKRRKPTSIQELQQFYGIIILMENTYGYNTQDRTDFFILKKNI